MSDPSFIIGVDGCPSGWVGVARRVDGSDAQIIMFEQFQEIVDHPLDFVKIAIDMPIGLPDFIHGSGRGPEQAVRPHLGKRRSSVFSIPSRAAVEEPDYVKGCAVALETSDPPKKFSKQGFNIFPKILEVDRVMTPALESRVYEVHPELAFWRLNGETPLEHAKKFKGRLNPDGFAERVTVLQEHGFSEDFLTQKPPKGSAVDDFIDACVCAVIAGRAFEGTVAPFPEAYARDSKGLRIAIWA